MNASASSLQAIRPPVALVDVFSGSPGIRELSREEIELVSGAFSFTELYGSMLAGALGGAVTGFATGGPAGAATGALAGATGGSVSYLAYELWMYCFG
jgi:hypothetical protein